MSTEIIGESPLYQYWVSTAEARGKEQGLNEGIHEGMRDLVRRSMEVRFGVLDQATTDAINAADENTLIAVNLQIGTASLDEIRARLVQRPATGTDTPSHP